MANNWKKSECHRDHNLKTSLMFLGRVCKCFRFCCPFCFTKTKKNSVKFDPLIRISWSDRNLKRKRLTAQNWIGSKEKERYSGSN